MEADAQEAFRRISNLVTLGKVCEIKSDEGLALARVELDGRVSDFLPVLLWNSDFVKVWMPIRIGQQVAVFFPFGEGDFGLVLPGIYHKGNREPGGANDGNVIVEIGGVRFESDGADLRLKAPGKIKIEAGGDIDIDGSTIHLNEEEI
jgi:phage baseplate assembly protein V